MSYPYIENKNNYSNFNNGDLCKNPNVRDGFFLLSEAAKKCSYSQEYLSLLARRGELKAEKIGRSWYTTDEWLREYVETHSVQKKGNVKGEIFEDKQYKKVIQQSVLNRSVSNYCQQLVDGHLHRIKLILVEIKNNILGLVKLVLNKITIISVLNLSKSRVRIKSANDDQISQRQIIIDQSANSIEQKQALDLAAMVHKASVSFSDRKMRIKFKSHYPFRQGLNGFILDNVVEIACFKIGKISFNPIAYLLELVNLKINFYFFTIKQAVKSFYRAPVFIIRYWPAISPWHRIRVAATSFAVIFLVAISALSQIDYQLADSLYNQNEMAVSSYVDKADRHLAVLLEKAEGAIGIRREITMAHWNTVSVNLANMVKAVVGMKDYSPAEEEEPTSRQVEARVAGLSTYSLPQIIASKTFIGLNNVNQAVEEIVIANLVEEATTSIRFEKLVKHSAYYWLRQLQSGRAISQNLSSKSAVRRLQLDNIRIICNAVNDFARHPNKLARTVVGKPANKKISLMAINNSFRKAGNALEGQIADGGSWLSNINARFFGSLSQFLVARVTGLPMAEIETDKMVLLANQTADRAGGLNLAFSGWARSLISGSEEVIQKKLGRWEKLGLLAMSGVEELGNKWQLASEKINEWFGDTESSLGESYLALLDALNLQPAYHGYGTSRTLIGVGDQPLDLEKEPTGLDDQGLAVVPLEESADQKQRNELADKIQATFSDEVEVIPDKDTATGMIRPTSKEIVGEDYMYVVVPIKGN